MPEIQTLALPKDLTAWAAELRTTIVDAVKAEVATGMRTATEAEARAKELLAQVDARKESLEKARRETDLPGSPKDGRDTYSVSKVVRAVVAGMHGEPNSFARYAPYEHEISEELRTTRAMGTTPDEAGGFIVPGAVMSERMVEPLRAEAIVFGLGAEELVLTTTPVDIPTIEEEPLDDDTDTSEGSVAENESLVEQKMRFGNLRAEPHTCGCYVPVSRRLLAMGPAADRILERIIGQRIGLKLNLWALKGTGAGAQPIGVLNTSGIQTVDFTGVNAGAAPSKALYQKMLAMEYRLRAKNALRGTPRWAMAPVLFNVLRQLHDENASAGTPSMSFARRLMEDGAITRILGHEFQTTTQLVGGADTEALFANWRDLWIARWGGLIIEASNVAGDALRRRQTHIAAWTEMDSLVQQPDSFCAALNLDTTAAVTS